MALDPYGNETDPYVAWAMAQPPPAPVDPFAVPLQPPPTEVPLGAVPPRLSPEEEAQIQIDQPPPEQPPAVDAVSAAAPPPTIAQRSDLDVSVEPYAPPPEAPDAYLERMTGLANEQPFPDVRQQMIGEATDKAVRAMSPEQFSDFKNNRASAALLYQSELEHKAIAENERRARENVEIQRAATEKADFDTKQLMADVQRISDMKVDPNHYGKTRGLGGALLDVAGSFFMGFSHPDIAQRNIEGKIQRDIAAQTADIENQWKGISTRRTAIGDELARHGDLYRAQETYRIAAYQSAINDIDTQLQLYDPAGSSAIRGREAREQLVAAQQKYIVDYNQKQLDNSIKIGEFALKQRDQDLKERQYLDKRAAAGAAKPVKFEDQPHTAAQLRQLGIPIDDSQVPPEGMSIAQSQKVAIAGKAGEERVKAQRENSPEERNRQLAVGEIVDDHGDPVNFRSPEFAGKLGSTKASVDTVSQYADELIDLYNAHGFESDFLKSPAWRQAQGAFASALLEAKQGDQLGALSGSDLELEAKKITGGVDVTGVRDPTEALQSFKRRMVTKVNSEIRAQAVLPNGRRVQPWKPVNTASSTMPKAKDDFIDTLGKRLTTTLLKVPEPTNNPLADMNQKIVGLIAAPINQQTEEDLQILESHAESGKYAPRARSLLRRLAKDAVYPEVRDRIKAYLDKTETPARDR